MHIELTDHLRCRNSHPESFLILLPYLLDDRLVESGLLACPECGWQCSWMDGVPDFGGGWEATAGFPVPAEAIPMMLGLEGPGGWIALVGRAGSTAAELAELMPGVHLVAINPPAGVVANQQVQIIRTDVWPLKRYTMRGIVAGSDARRWNAEMPLSLLHGRQMVAEGEAPVGVEELVSAAGIWVGRPLASSRENPTQTG